MRLVPQNGQKSVLSFDFLSMLSRWRLALFFFALCFMHSQSLAQQSNQKYAQSIPLTVSKYSANDAPYIPAKPSEIPQWLNKLNPVKNVDLSGGSYWFYTRISAQTTDREWVVNLSQANVENVDIYLYDNHKRMPLTAGNAYGTDYEFGAARTIKLKANFDYQLLVKISSQYYVSQPQLELLAKDHFQQRLVFDTALKFTALGIILAVGLLVLFVYFHNKQKSLLFLGLYALCLFIATSFVLQLPGKLFQWPMLSYTYIPFFILPLLGALFCSAFLDLDKHYLLLDKVLKINAVIALLLAPSSAFMLSYAPNFVMVTQSIWMLVAGYAAVKIWQTGHQAAKYLLIGLSISFIPSLLAGLESLEMFSTLLINDELLILISGTLGLLCFAFSTLFNSQLLMQKSQQQCHQFEQKVQEQNATLSQTRYQLEQSNHELIEASLAKERFLATINHEICTPLTTIIGYADGILLGDIDKAEQQRVIEIMADNGNHLLRVMNDILDISKIEANKLDFENKPTALFSILAQLESGVGKRARDKGLAFHLDYAYPLPAQIYTDPKRLKQILFNLTNNAIKYTEKGFIGLSVSIVDNKLKIEIKDSGEGIAELQLEKLFVPFAQADNAINRRMGGIGLGLSISQSLAKGLGGEIKVSSTPRKGSIFSFEMPLMTVEDSPWISNVSEIWQSTPTKSVKPKALPNFAGCKVLLADDHPESLELIAILLKRMNIQVTEVDSGKQAIDTLFYHNFDLILLDIHMPHMDGPEALKQIRSEGNVTPVIALTANNMKHQIEHYLRLGFNDHLTKPIERQAMINKLNLWLNHTKDKDNEGPLHKEDMLTLVQDYKRDLAEQIQQIEQALQHRDLSLIAEYAHKIVGSAGSFGFDIVGEKFANIEHSALQDDEIAVTYELPKVIQLTQQCLNLPGVDIAQALVNHQYSAERFLNNIYELNSHGQQSLNDLKAAIDNNETNSALLHLYKFFPAVFECALLDSEAAFKALEEQIKQGVESPAQYQAHLKVIQTHLQALNQVLQPSLMEQI
ncbi:response regulator [Paraglaciecola aestuariivivens]